MVGKLTPAMVFKAAHKELVVEGEKWMEDAANLCSLVAALIAMVMLVYTITKVFSVYLFASSCNIKSFYVCFTCIEL